MVLSVLASAALFAAAVDPQRVTGYCERGGKSLAFVDAIAFPDARDREGATTITLYLVSVPLDREALAQCLHCGRPLPDKPRRSVRREAVEAQVRASNGGWLQVRRFGGADGTVVVVDILHAGPDGAQSSIMAGNERADVRLRDEDDHIAGKVASSGGYGNTCDAVFDLELGWPKVQQTPP